MRIFIPNTSLRYCLQIVTRDLSKWWNWMFSVLIMWPNVVNICNGFWLKLSTLLIVSLSVLHYSFSETAHVNYVSKSYLSVKGFSRYFWRRYWLIDNSRDNKDEADQIIYAIHWGYITMRQFYRHRISPSNLSLQSFSILVSTTLYSFSDTARVNYVLYYLSVTAFAQIFQTTVLVDR